MPDFLIDTDVLIDVSRGNLNAADFVDGLDGEIYIGRVSAMELVVGARFGGYLSEQSRSAMSN